MIPEIAIDFIPLIPNYHLLPSWITSTHDNYITDYNDPLFVRNPPFFQLTTWLELFILVPLEIGGIWGLINGISPPLFLTPSLCTCFYPTTLAIGGCTTFINGRNRNR